MEKLVVVYKNREYFNRARANLGQYCGKQQLPTTSFNEVDISMTIERGEIVDPYAIEINCLQLSDSSDQNQMTLTVTEVKSLNGRDPTSF